MSWEIWQFRKKITSRQTTSVSRLVRSTVWSFLGATSPQAKILPRGNWMVGCYIFCSDIIDVIIPKKDFCKWKVLIHQQGVVASHGRRTHSVTTQGVPQTIVCIWFPQRYSHSSCRLECGIREALATSDCLPWYVICVGWLIRIKCHQTVFHWVGTCPRIPMTQKLRAGASIFVHRRTRPVLHRSLFFSVRARRKNSWGKWAAQRNPTATAFLTVSSWTCSILSARPTLCEWCKIY